MNTKRGQENYLRVIYEIDEYENNGVKNIEIAKILKISKSSVSETLGRMKKSNLVKFEPYSKIFLTEKGRRIARKLCRKHELIEKFAKKIGHEKAHEEAHELEHSLSDEMLNKLSQLMNQEEITEDIPAPSYIR